MGSLCSKTPVTKSPVKYKLLITDLPSSLLTKEQDIAISPASFVKQNKAEFYRVYNLEKFPLGSGARGEVRICTHRQTGDVRVVKIISKAKFCYTLSSSIVLEEVNILKKLDHPNLPRIFEFFEDSSYYYIVLEYCKGGDLFDRITEMKSFEESQAAEIMSQVLAGVNYLHSKAVIHRDIKPENILLEDKQSLVCKIIDFDTATLFKSEFYEEKFGTPVYMAPEVIKGRYNEKCDLWSCGIILYILLAGGLPFDGTDEELFNLIPDVKIRIEGPNWEGVSEPARDLLSRLLTNDPDQRISAAEACLHPWFSQYSKSASTEKLSRVLTGIRNYKRKNMLKEAIHTFIISKIIDSSEFAEEKEVFQSIDTNKDGTISRQELADVFVSDSVPQEEAIMYADLIFEQVDPDQKGCIDYTDFIKASARKTKVFNRENLIHAFTALDTKGTGTIEVEELKQFLTNGFEITENLLFEIMTQADINGDGKIDMNDFESLLVEKVSRSSSGLDSLI